MKRNNIVRLLALSGLLAAPLAAQNTVEAELRIAEDVVDREPVGEGEAFPADVGELVAWTSVTGAEGRVIEHVWRHGEQEWVVPLNIGGSPWRTWSRKTVPPELAGDWEVVVRVQDGQVLAMRAFTVGG